ncbi:3-carboxy-cis,cis-muconate cycloisomerase [Promicromonospora umidemergens]|uniref:3-carboxy-cis,cis-muconate cycloisomerase n=1 Tax=Promicromonospora umidemergens TaxID=629679 RepID=A0ABP8XNQ6_9MICO|nr:lyase family protein [Promicromonospora umidemergens]MCP2282027.1 3-carboxy-cis,cis-muconate cycloisomerase [Promicromonospora umidemergens]
MPDVGLLTPGADLAPGSPAAVTDDLAVLRAMLRAEAAWVRVVARHRGEDAVAGEIDAVVERLAGTDADALALATRVARASGAGGNPVIPLVAELRAAAGPRLVPTVHAGLTSQDVLDTALVLVLREAAHGIGADLDRAAAAVARLAVDHRGRPALGRTLAQAAVPTTLGARFAGWLQGLVAAQGFLAETAHTLPLAYGGAAGELSGVSDMADGDPVADCDPFALVEAWGDELGLPVGPGPWHVTRTPVVRLASALAETCAALGKVANDVLQAVRPGVGELREPVAPGRGASSAMAHKRNPVLSVLVRRSAIAAPHLAAQVLSAAGLAVDERSDGAWHAEWPALQQLARHTIASAHAAAELLEGLEVDAEAVARNLRDELPDVGRVPDVGAAAAVVDRVLDRLAEQPADAGRPSAVGEAPAEGGVGSEDG